MSQRFIVLIVPFGLLVAGFVMVHWFGFEDDPDYSYLLNGLMIFAHRLPVYSDHPGTTVILSSAVMETITWVCRGLPGSIVDDVLLHPDTYLAAINGALLVVIAASVAFLGYRVADASGRNEAGLAAQAVALASFPVALALPRVSPEPVLVALAALFAGLLAPYVQGLRSARMHPAQELLVGLVLGSCVATKITAAPLALLVMLLPDRRARARAIVAAAAAAIVLTALIAPRYGMMIETFWSMLSHRQAYGSGAAGLPDMSALWAGIVRLAHDAPEFFVGLFVSAVLAIWRRDRMWAVLACVLLVQIFVVAKQPSPRYLLPALAVLILIPVALWQAGRVARIAACAILAVGVVSNGIATLAWAQPVAVARQENNALLASLRHDGCAFVMIYDAIPSQRFKLWLGNDFAGGAFKQRLTALYPDFLTFNFGSSHFETFEKRLSIDEVHTWMASHRCVYLFGSPLERFARVDALKHAELIRTTGSDLGLATGAYRLPAP